MANAPTLIDLPPPPSDPVTPSDVPSRSGTPNSTTTSMSELSTVAIKDGHRGHLPHHAQHQVTSMNTQLDAERADRISRLAGLTHVTSARYPPTPNANLTPGSVAAAPLLSGSSYFDASGNPAMRKEISTVGSASATGSVGARTTWAGSEAGDTNMSETADLDNDQMDTSSVGGQSEEGTGSLVAFGEGARTPARGSTIGSPLATASAISAGLLPTAATKGQTPLARDPRTIDGVVYDQDPTDPSSSTTSTQNPVRSFSRPTTAASGASLSASSFGGAPGAPAGAGTEQAERIVRENMNTTSADRMTSMRRAAGGVPGPDLGKFGFEK